MNASLPAYPAGARASAQRALLAPVAWVGRQPLRRAQRLTGWLAGPLRLLMRRRARIVARNLALCFPERDAAERRALQRAHFRQLAEAIGEIAVAWHHPGTLDAAFGNVVGLEHVDAARAGGRGVLLVTGHVTCLELGARLLGERVAASAIYRPLSNAVLETAQNRGRARYAEHMIPRKNLRAMVRHLRAAGVLWYAPDQDLGPERSRFAPFFGVATATATGMLELARLGRARVVPMMPVKDAESGRVRVVIEPALDSFPSDDPDADLARFNAFLERRVRTAPAQYWWLHRRFKTAPPDEGDRYAGL
jgi:KDO2-lipid IV(A) lauroyltransferase